MQQQARFLKLFSGFLLSLLMLAAFIFPSKLKAQQDSIPLFVIESVADTIGLNDYLEVLEDMDHSISWEILQTSGIAIHFRPYSYYEKPLSGEKSYWGRIRIKNELGHDSKWILYTQNAGFVDVYVEETNGDFELLRSGHYLAKKLKAIPEGNFAVVPLPLLSGEEKQIYLHIREADHSSINFDLRLIEPAYWAKISKDKNELLIIFFEGIFLIMALYNLVLFFTVRFRAYLYYSLYLFCVALFVAFAVGPLLEPPFGDPVLLTPIGYLAFGCINIFYFLFGRSFLNTKELIPKWDIIILWYVRVKTVIIVGVIAMLYIRFDLGIALKIEFGMMFLDVFLSLLLFFILARTRSRLTYFFIAGSASVIVFGLSLAALGHIIKIPYSFLFFLSSIIVEIIFFSLGLGYRIRLSEKEKLTAERQNREAQEALNQELSKINSAFGRFVPHEFLRSLGHNSILDVKLGDGAEKEVSVFFSDIRDYTSLSEQMEPRENFQFLNAYLGRVGPTIQTYRGFVNQYYGDGIMALFMNHPEDALMAAIEVLRVLGYYNEERKQKDRLPIRIGIGLHTGSLMMGVIGDTLRMEAGVVSDAVNTASRMEGLTKFFGATILLSEDTLKQIPRSHRYKLRFLGKVQVKGRKEPIRVYECFEGDSAELVQLKDAIKADFDAGMAHYFSKEFAQAARAFDKVLEVFPGDIPTRRYHAYTLKHLTDGVSEDWSGVEMMLEK